MNYLQNKLNTIHTGEFLPYNYAADDFFELSIKTSKPVEISPVDSKFDQLFRVLVQSYEKLVESLKEENDFFQPQLIMRLDGKISVKVSLRKKEEKLQ